MHWAEAIGVDTMAKLYFIRRTPSDFQIFGGSVYADIDGKCVGEVGMNDLVIDVTPGVHIIKMYKSHTYNHFIGFAETMINVEEGKDLTLTYSPPMLITQPGYIVVADFISIYEINRQLEQREWQLRSERIANDYRIHQEIEASNKSSNNAIGLIIGLCVVLPAVIGLLYFFIEMAFLGSLF